MSNHSPEYASAGRQAEGQKNAAVKMTLAVRIDESVASWLPQCIGLAKTYYKPVSAIVELVVKADGSIWLTDRQTTRPVWQEIQELIEP